MGYQNTSGNRNTYQKITWTLRRFRGRNIKTLSSSDKNTIIACMSIIIDASAKGIRPDPSVIALIKEVSFSARDLDGQSAGIIGLDDWQNQV